MANAFNQNWITQWQLAGWKTASKSEVKNQDLWKSLLLEMQKHKITFFKVKGHADNEFNNRCDELAREQIVICKKNQSDD